LSDEPEYGLLMALETGPQTHAELATRTGLSTGEINHLLFKLIRETYVYESFKDGRGTEYRLTPLGIGKVTMIHKMLAGGEASFSQFIGAVTEANRRTRESLRRDEMQTVRLSDGDRTVAATALAEQFGLGRIDMTELSRRTELLHAAQLHSDLGPVFEGLPDPPLYRQAATQRASWPWILVGLAGGVAIMSLVFAFVMNL
jgi:DNA-binding MarR family transcriptional regulator